jgi:hypothetical protein
MISCLLAISIARPVRGQISPADAMRVTELYDETILLYRNVRMRMYTGG